MIGFIVFLFISAAVLGAIISIMERESFPGWGPMIICVLAGAVPQAIINAILPDFLFFIGLVIGAVCAGCAISYMVGMTLKRAMIAAAIYFAVMFAISLTCLFGFSRPATT
jgi:hypothetical protein